MRLLLRTSAGLLLWAVGFSVLYALHGIGCAWRWDAVPLAGIGVFRVVMVGTWLFFAALGVAIVMWCRTLPDAFERRLACAGAWAGLVSTIVAGAPVAVASSCI